MKDWYECKKCGYAFDYLDMAFNQKNRKMYCRYFCLECWRTINTNRTRKYYSTKIGRAIVRKINNKSQKKYQFKQRARKVLNYHIRVGNIRRKPCVICGAKKSHGHHEDYSKPLNVIWLCPLHHKQVDMGKIVIPKETLWITNLPHYDRVNI